MPGDNSATDKIRAQSLNRTGLLHYERWEIESAITLFREATRLDDGTPEFWLNLARAHVRMGDYEAMLHALGNYIRVEQNQTLLQRFEALFSNALDPIETLLTATMPQHEVGLEIIGAAIQMWLEYRVAIGKRYLDLTHPAGWAAALDYTVRKINFIEVPAAEIAQWYKVGEGLVRNYHSDLVTILDIMPCDYRYFRGSENPLDKLVEAAVILEELEKRFLTV